MADTDEKLRRNQREEKLFKALHEEYDKDVVDRQRVREIIKEYVEEDRLEKLRHKKLAEREHGGGHDEATEKPTDGD